MPKLTFTMQMSDEMDRMLDELKEFFGKPSKAETVRLGIALLKIASDARKEGKNFSVVYEDGHVENILFPA